MAYNTKVELYQLLEDLPDRHDLIFASLTELERAGKQVRRENYFLAYSCMLRDGVDLDDVFEVFNIDRPDDYHVRSLSVSDVVVVEEPSGEKRAWYCDCIGWTELADFLPEPDPDEIVVVATCMDGDDQVANFVHAQKTEDGWDYTIYSEGLSEVDGGQVDAPFMTVWALLADLCFERGWREYVPVSDMEAFLQEAERVAMAALPCAGVAA